MKLLIQIDGTRQVVASMLILVCSIPITYLLRQEILSLKWSPHLKTRKVKVPESISRVPTFIAKNTPTDTMLSMRNSTVTIRWKRLKDIIITEVITESMDLIYINQSILTAIMQDPIVVPHTMPSSGSPTSTI